MNIKNCFLLAITSLIIGISCKKKFDEPATVTDPAGMKANLYIADLKSGHSNGAIEQLTGDSIVSGVVIANDKSGNIYKQIFIQDSTGALLIDVDMSNSYVYFPEGRRVFVKLKGLVMTDYGGMIKLSYPDNSIPSNPQTTAIPASVIDNFIIRGSFNNPVPFTTIDPTVTLNSQLSTNSQSPILGTLIRLTGYEFLPVDTAESWADTSATKNSLNRTLKDCAGNTIIVRTSGYARFAGFKTPLGNGTITGVYTVFRGARQLLLKDTADCSMWNVRCNGFLFPPTYLFDASPLFNTITGTSTNINFSGWYNIPEGNPVYFKGVSNASGKYASLNPFNTATGNVATWLITPQISIPSTVTNPVLMFNTSKRFDNGSSWEVYVSTNYNGNNTPSQAPNVWDTVYRLTTPGPTGNTWQNFASGRISLSKYVGKSINIGWKYTGNVPSQTSAIQIDAPFIAY